MLLKCRKGFVPFDLVWIFLNSIFTAGVEVIGQNTTVRLLDDASIAIPRGPFETNINIIVLVPPVVTVDGKAHVSHDSEVILASCFASNARPAADVVWRLGDLNNSLRTTTDYMMHPDETFTVVTHLLGAPLKHLNQKNIQCVVTHSTSGTHEYELDYILNVHYPPELVMIIPADPTEPKEFYCKADSNPRPSSYTWIKLNQSTPISYGNKLSIPGRASDFNGVYICKVSNQYGSASGVLYFNHSTASSLIFLTNSISWFIESCWSLCWFVFLATILCVVYMLKNASSSRQPSS